MAKSIRFATRASEPQGLARHFEGWQPGLVAVVLAAIVAVLAVPRSIEPMELPVPVADVQQLRTTMRADDDAARSVVKNPLDTDVRALGSLMRAFGKADAERDEAMLAQLHSRIFPTVVVARNQGDAALVALRAFQMQQFLREVRRFVVTGQTSDELVELGGAFGDVLLRSGWCTGTPPYTMLMPEQVLRVVYKRRWNEITGLSGPPFEPTIDEKRVFLAFLLRHPARAGDRLPSSTSPGFDGAYLLRKVEEAGTVDPLYPQLFARGIVQFRKGDFRRAAESFATHLETSPDGPWALRAQNHLRAALELAHRDAR